MSTKVIYENGKLDNGNRWRYFGQHVSNERNGIGMLQWPDSGDDGLSYLAIGKFENGYINGFGLCAFKESIEVYTHVDAQKDWTCEGACATFYNDSALFYYKRNGKTAYRSFSFTNGSNILTVNYYNNKEKIINTESYKLPFTFSIKNNELFSLKNETIPHFYNCDGIYASSTTSINKANVYYSIKEFSNGVQIGQFKNDLCDGFGAYYFNTTHDVCIGRFNGTKNNGYVVYTYDSGNSIRYGFLDSEDRWQGYVIELDDEHVLNILEKKDNQTIKTYRIRDLELIKDEVESPATKENPITKENPSIDPNELIDLIKGEAPSTTLTVQEMLNGDKEVTDTKGPVNSLDELIGLESVKNAVKLVLNLVLKAKKAKKTKNLDRFSMHMAFVGNPGTGKTQVAKLLANELHKIGYLPSNKLIEVDRSKLVGKYIGESESIVNDYIKQAMGGVLFIDEAYSLYVKDSEKDYGNQVIDTLVKAMEDYRGKFVVILAGYKDETKEMIDSNPGLKSRIRHTIEFPNYTREELEQIGHLFLKDYEYEITPEAMSLASEVVYSKVFEKGFGNARAMRSALETIIMYQSQRTCNENNYEDFLITVKDVEAYAALEKYEITEKGQDIMGSTFDKLVGLTNVKKILKLIEAHVNKNKKSISSTHMVFAGNPGTGKTTVARLIAKILYRAGVLPTDKLVEVDRSHLVGRYVGETAIKTNEVVRGALGGVLFIDEAYSLIDGDHHSFGSEAIATILRAMEEHRDKLCVIFAGYKEEMSQFLQVNPGLTSRIFFHINFDDYTEEELCEIGIKLVEEQNYQIDNDTAKALASLAYSLKGSRSFANARTIRNFVSQLIMIQSARTGATEDRLITMDDIKVLAEDSGLSLTASKKEGEIPVPSYEYLKQLSDTWDSDGFVYNKQDTDERVVHLTTTKENGMSEGSGFIITPDGYYITCHHCINGAKEIKTRVTYYNRHGKRLYMEYDTTVVAYSEKHDCAICKMNNLDCELPYMPLSFEPLDTLKDNQVVLAGYPHGLRRVNEISFFEGKVISQQHLGDDDKIYTDIMGKSGCSGSAVFYKDTGKVIGVFCGAMLSHNQNITEEMNYLKPISHSIDLTKK